MVQLACVQVYSVGVASLPHSCVSATPMCETGMKWSTGTPGWTPCGSSTRRWRVPSSCTATLSRSGEERLLVLCGPPCSVLCWEGWLYCSIHWRSTHVVQLSCLCVLPHSMSLYVHLHMCLSVCTYLCPLDAGLSAALKQVT